MILVLWCLLGIDPLVSVGAAQRSPSAPVVVTPDGCEEGCKCNGTGEELSGDGILKVNCRCDDSCKCKKGTGSPSEAIVAPFSGEPVCVDGSCGKPAKSAPVARRGLFGRWR